MLAYMTHWVGGRQRPNLTGRRHARAVVSPPHSANRRELEECRADHSDRGDRAAGGRRPAVKLPARRRARDRAAYRWPTGRRGPLSDSGVREGEDRPAPGGRAQPDHCMAAPKGGPSGAPPDIPSDRAGGAACAGSIPRPGAPRGASAAPCKGYKARVRAKPEQCSTTKCT